MRFIVYGAGAVGGVVGARLHQHGHDTVLIARGDHAAVIARRGLRLETPDGATTHHMPVFTSPAEVDPEAGDVVLMAVKSQDTAAAVEVLAAAVPPETPVVCLQNGVANEREPCGYFANVHSCHRDVPDHPPRAGHRPVGVGADHRPARIGRYPTGSDDIDRDIARLVPEVDVRVCGAPLIVMRWKYGKLLMNLRNAADALRGRPAVGGEVADRAVAEGRACLTAAGIDLRRARTRTGSGGATASPLRPVGERRHSSSSWQSLARGAATHRDRLPERRDRAHRPAHGRPDTRQRAAATAGAGDGRVRRAAGQRHRSRVARRTGRAVRLWVTAHFGHALQEPAGSVLRRRVRDRRSRCSSSSCAHPSWRPVSRWSRPCATTGPVSPPTS